MTLPEPFKKSFRAWQQGEWFRVGLSEDVGGVPAPSMLAWAINEFALGAQPAAFMYLGRSDDGRTSSTRSATSSSGTGRR